MAEGSVLLSGMRHTLYLQSYKDYLRDNVARIRDIELLTGLQFMTFKSDMSTRLRTFLPIDLWDSTMFRTWSDIPCSEQDQCPSE